MSCSNQIKTTYATLKLAFSWGIAMTTSCTKYCNVITDSGNIISRWDYLARSVYIYMYMLHIYYTYIYIETHVLCIYNIYTYVYKFWIKHLVSWADNFNIVQYVPRRIIWSYMCMKNQSYLDYLNMAFFPAPLI